MSDLPYEVRKQKHVQSLESKDFLLSTDIK